jgi:hypothetical protein
MALTMVPPIHMTTQNPIAKVHPNVAIRVRNMIGSLQAFGHNNTSSRYGRSLSSLVIRFEDADVFLYICAYLLDDQSTTVLFGLFLRPCSVTSLWLHTHEGFRNSPKKMKASETSSACSYDAR